MTPALRHLKHRTRMLIEAVGGLDAAATYTRIGKSDLQRCYSFEHPDRFLAIDVAVDLERVAADREGAPHLIGAVCDMIGGAFAALPAGVPCDGDLIGSVGSVAREAADVTQAICAAIADGPMSEARIDAIRIEIAQAHAALAVVDLQLQMRRGRA
ncbi:phage regulatory CII family protein [Sphingomonas hengshuiensis]|uniref:Uncharacterized protein n=1 Tax=Sphingomonas hengshuiensis TaxID=1609977 RepID=A0A7U4LFH4_9SPHN|nr:hypothetical protein [Sphingomonas hengshuiensis]AJP72283.1 hypothetical protein TS85_11530 [Sphingomonas hengshuiensis]